MLLQHSFPVHGCIALVDERFVQWLLGHAGDHDAGGCAELESVDRQRLAKRLAAAALQAGVHAKFGWMRWYASHPDQATLPRQVLKEAPPESADSVFAPVLAPAPYEWRLAQGDSCASGLRASDDGRLLTTVDHLQHHGMQVHLVADRSATNLPGLARADPSWSSLLRQEDSRPLLDSSEGAEEYERTRAPRQAPEDCERGIIVALVNLWLDSLYAPQRTHLQFNLPWDRDLRQEEDPELLLDISHHLGRPPTVNEHKVLLEAIRYALEHTVPPGGAGPESHTPHPLQSRPCEEAPCSP